MTQTTTPQKRGALARIAHFTVIHRRSVMLVWLVIAFAAAPLALTLTKALSGAGWEAQGSDAQLVRDELRRDFPQAGAESAIVVFQQEEPFTTSPTPLSSFVAALAQAPGADGAIDPLTMPAEAGLVARDGRTALIPVALSAEVDADRPESAGEVMKWVDSYTYASGTSAKAPDGAMMASITKAASVACAIAVAQAMTG
jgi:RND superfamily putative drug exporter